MVRTDSAVKTEGTIIKEPFDYTKWQENLFEDMSVRELSNKAMQNIEK